MKICLHAILFGKVLRFLITLLDIQNFALIRPFFLLFMKFLNNENSRTSEPKKLNISLSQSFGKPLHVRLSKRSTKIRVHVIRKPI